MPRQRRRRHLRRGSLRGAPGWMLTDWKACCSSSLSERYRGRSALSLPLRFLLNFLSARFFWLAFYGWSHNVQCPILAKSLPTCDAGEMDSAETGGADRSACCVLEGGSAKDCQAEQVGCACAVVGAAEPIQDPCYRSVEATQRPSKSRATTQQSLPRWHQAVLAF